MKRGGLVFGVLSGVAVALLFSSMPGGDRFDVRAGDLPLYAKNTSGDRRYKGAAGKGALFRVTRSGKADHQAVSHKRVVCHALNTGQITNPLGRRIMIRN